MNTLFREHSCARTFDNKRAKQKWLIGLFRQKVQDNPKFKCREMKEEVLQQWNVQVSKDKCKRAKRAILEEIEGSYIDEFAKLQAYCNEVRQSDPGTDAWVQLSREELNNGKRVFKRMYMCFNAAKVSLQFSTL